MDSSKLTFPERITFAQRPTPLQLLPRLSQRIGKRVYLWRDDLTGWELSGNKIRKLEFLCAEAASQGANHLVTCGGPQSNHARATAFVARRMGWDVTVVVREPQEVLSHQEAVTGNLLFDHLLAADLHFIPFAEYQKGGGTYIPFLEKTAAGLREQGVRPYVIPEGGSCPLGCWGYLAAMQELAEATDDTPRDLFCAVGSGGTFAGLELGRSLCNPNWRLHGVNVCNTAPFFQDRIQDLIATTCDRFKLPYQTSRLNIYDGFVGDGYAQASDDDLRFYASLAQQEGVLLDPVYTGKAFQGMLHCIQERPGDFGDEVIFLHSGGQFATFAFADQYRRALHGPSVSNPSKIGTQI